MYELMLNVSDTDNSEDFFTDVELFVSWNMSVWHKVRMKTSKY